MPKINRPSREYLARQIISGKSSGHQAQREVIGGAQSVVAPNVTVTAASAAWWNIARQSNTSISAACSVGDTALTLTSTSIAGLIPGAVIALGTINGTNFVAAGGTTQIFWVTDVDTSTNIVTIQPPVYTARASGTAVSVLCSIVADCYTAHDTDGTDLGTTALVSISSRIQDSITHQDNEVRVYVAALRTGMQYGKFDPANQYPQAQSPGAIGSQVSSVIRLSFGDPSSHWTTAPLAQVSGTTLYTLEGAQPWWTSTQSAASVVGASSATISTSGFTQFMTTDISWGDQDEPNELIIGSPYNGSATSFTSIGVSQYAHRAGATVEAPTASGVTSWTFFPIYYLASADAAGIAFALTLLTVDPR